MTKHSFIAIAVVQRDQSFLVGQRPTNVPLAGLWEFPGGKLEAGESAEQAAQRECLEETGLPIQIQSQLAEIHHTYAHGQLTLTFFAATVAEESRNQAPRPPFQWIDRSELQKLEFPPANVPILAMLADDPRKILAKEMI